MKKLLYLALVLILPTSLLVADSGNHRIEGYWFSTNANYEIQIKSKSYGLKVKGLPGSRDSWKRFRVTSRHDVFKDYSGNVLIRDSRKRLVYKKSLRNRGYREERVYHFSRSNYDSFDYRSRSYSGGDCGTPRGYVYPSDDRYDNYDDRDYYDDDRYDRGRSASSIRSLIAGEWKTVGLNNAKRVEIRTVQTGINARFKTRDNWTFFAQDRNDPNLFVDRKGNKYILKRDLSLKWIGINGKDFVLEKY